MKEDIINFLKSNKDNYHSIVKIELRFGKCSDILDELVNDGLVEKRNGLNTEIFKIKQLTI